MTMSSSQASGATPPGTGGQLEDAVTAFSDAVFEASQGLLRAQQQLTRTLLSGRGGQTEGDLDEEPRQRSDEHETGAIAADAGSGEPGDDRDQATSDMYGDA